MRADCHEITFPATCRRLAECSSPREHPEDDVQLVLGWGDFSVKIARNESRNEAEVARPRDAPAGRKSMAFSVVRLTDASAPGLSEKPSGYPYGYRPT